MATTGIIGFSILSVYIAIVFYFNGKNKNNNDGELLTDEEGKQVWEEIKTKLEEDGNSTS